MTIFSAWQPGCPAATDGDHAEQARLGTAVPHAQRLPDDVWIRLFLDQITGFRAMRST